MGNFLLHLMIGARRRVPAAQPLLVYLYVFGFGAAFTGYSLILRRAWIRLVTFYNTPLSTNYGPPGMCCCVGRGVFVVGILLDPQPAESSLRPPHMLRAIPGPHLFRLPLVRLGDVQTVSCHGAGDAGACDVLLLVHRGSRSVRGFRFSMPPAAAPSAGSSSFWFYSIRLSHHDLPAMGVVSEVTPAVAATIFFGYAFMVYALIAIAVVGVLVWGHHISWAGQSLRSPTCCFNLSFIVAVPVPPSGCSIGPRPCTAARYVNEAGRCPMLWAFVGRSRSGRTDGALPCFGSDRYSRHHDVFVIAPFPFRHGGTELCPPIWPVCTFGGPVTGRQMYSEAWALFARLSPRFPRFNATFPPQFVMGWNGMPRRSITIPDVFLPGGHVMSRPSPYPRRRLCALAADLFSAVPDLWRRAPPANPGNATARIATSSPPPKETSTRIPRVDVEPYAYTLSFICDGG